MKILVTVKRTPHRDTRMAVSPDGRLRLDDVDFEVNPFDELAVEEALRLAESDATAETVVVTVGGEDATKQLLTALAMGIDRAIRVDADGELDSLDLARTLAAVVERERPDLVLSGKLAVDDENGQVPTMLAGRLDWPQATQASAIEAIEAGRVRVTCEVDSGTDVVELELPAVVTADLRLNEPRYASLPGIMRAKKKPLDVIAIAELGAEVDAPSGRARLERHRKPPAKPAGRIVASADELAAELAARKLLPS